MATILLVDDEKEIRDFITTFLEERNFKVSSAVTAAEALRKIEADRPEIVLLEVRIENMAGLEILERVKKISRNTQVVVVTWIDDLTIANKAKSLGAIAYLTKPILLDELMEEILVNLGRPRRFFKLKKAAWG